MHVAEALWVRRICMQMHASAAMSPGPPPPLKHRRPPTHDTRPGSGSHCSGARGARALGSVALATASSVGRTISSASV